MPRGVWVIGLTACLVTTAVFAEETKEGASASQEAAREAVLKRDIPMPQRSVPVIPRKPATPDRYRIPRPGHDGLNRRGTVPQPAPRLPKVERNQTR